MLIPLAKVKPFDSRFEGEVHWESSSQKPSHFASINETLVNGISIFNYFAFVKLHLTLLLGRNLVLAPSTFVLMASNGLYSTVGTFFVAAAWIT